MPKGTRKRVIWILGSGSLLAVLAFLFWWSNPEQILAVTPLLEKKGESGGQWLRDKLIACGPRAIQPTIRAIAEHSPWVRNYAYLPSVLKHFGERARKELIVAIDNEPDSTRRAYLVSALQSGFNNFTRLDTVLTDAKQKSSRVTLRFMAQEIRRAFPNAPDLVNKTEIEPDFSVGINPDFIAWWSTNKLDHK